MDAVAERAFAELASRIPVAEIRLFSQALNYGVPTGVNLIELVRSFSSGVRIRNDVEAEISRTLNLPKYNNRIIMCTPFVMIAIMRITAADYLRPLESGTGFIVKTAAAAAILIALVLGELLGDINYAEGRETPEIDEGYPYQSAQINLAEPTVYTFAAAPQTGYLFVKWTKDGKDCSTAPIITVNLDESADYVAVFEENPDWQNPVVKLSGEYQCDRAHATVQDFDLDSAWITIEWAGSAWETARWIISGPLDIGTMTITYEGCQKDHLVYDENGEITSQEKIYEDGTGTIVFNGDGTFTWHEDQSETGEDMTFELLPAEQE